jgi:hypothetical protein
MPQTQLAGSCGVGAAGFGGARVSAFCFLLSSSPFLGALHFVGRHGTSHRSCSYMYPPRRHRHPHPHIPTSQLSTPHDDVRLWTTLPRDQTTLLSQSSQEITPPSIYDCLRRRCRISHAWMTVLNIIVLNRKSHNTLLNITRIWSTNWTRRL